MDAKRTMKEAKNALFPAITVVAAFTCAWIFLKDKQPESQVADTQTAVQATQNGRIPGPTSRNPYVTNPSGSKDGTINRGPAADKVLVSTQEKGAPSNDGSGTLEPNNDSGSQKINSKNSYSGASAPSKSDLAKLDIPDICTAELPGLNFEAHRKAIVDIRDAILDSRTSGNSRPHPSQQDLAQKLDQSSSSIPHRGQSFESLDRALATPHQSPQAPSSQNSTAETHPNQKQLSVLNQQEATELKNLLVATNQTQQPISNTNYNPHKNASFTQNEAYKKAAANPHVDPHVEAFSRSAFPSANECKSCHEQIYREWSMSSHAYASISPMFHKFEQRINDLAQGTIGYFCLRCHAPVATTMELRRDQAIWDGPRVFREGVTCVACHRVVQAHGKDNGERRMEPGPVYSPIVGATDGIGVEVAKKYKEHFKVKTDPQNKKPGQLIHRRVIKFDQLSKSTFCVSCHQVAVEPGIALEVVWNQYRASPAWRKGITCQDCHMGRVPGMAEGYSVGPVAIIDGKQVTPDRKHSNHQFYGPGYSIAHPGIFPQNPDADKWTVNEWLQFDWRAGWGTEAFEEALQQGRTFGYFPPVWSDPDDRMDAREIVDANLKLLAYKRDLRRQVMENGAKVEGPYFAKDPRAGAPLKFHYKVTNTNIGHNMPSGSLGAQPQLWLNVVLIGPRGNRLWESGYLDSVGDLADLHSDDVLNRKVPLDTQLFNLQTKFLTTNVKGTDREMYLPVPFDGDQLPFIRPDARPNTVMNHPPFIRMEGHSIAATGSRNAKYKIPAHLMQEPGLYRLSVRMRSRAEPIYFMKFVKATPEMIRAMNEGILDVHTFSKTFEVR